MLSQLGINLEGQGAVDSPKATLVPTAFVYFCISLLGFGCVSARQRGCMFEPAGLPTGTNCWMWELDPVEGTAGWEPGTPLPGNLNMAYSTEMPGIYFSSLC